MFLVVDFRICPVLPAMEIAMCLCSACATWDKRHPSCYGSSFFLFLDTHVFSVSCYGSVRKNPLIMHIHIASLFDTSNPSGRLSRDGRGCMRGPGGLTPTFVTPRLAGPQQWRKRRCSQCRPRRNMSVEWIFSLSPTLRSIDVCFCMNAILAKL